MIGRYVVVVNVVALSVGCASEPGREIAPAPGWILPVPSVELTEQKLPGEHGIVGSGPGVLPAARLRDYEPKSAPENARGDDSIMLKLASSLSDVTYAEDGGDAITEALSEFSSRKVEEYGAGLLTPVQLFGDPFHASICDPGELEAKLDDKDGNSWAARLEMPQYVAFVDEPEVLFSTISGRCADAVSGGDIEAALEAGECSENEYYQFFEAGGACRDCVETTGDFRACMDSDACYDTAPQVTWVLENGEKAWYQMVEGVAWACRPDWLALVYVLAHIPPDGTMPETYDHADWNYYCFPLYDAVSGAQYYACDAGDSPERGHTMGEGLIGRTIEMVNDAGEAAFGSREYYSPKIELKAGATLRWSWANSGNIGRLSKPFSIGDSNGDGVSGPGDENYGYAMDSWGINPHALRPGGTDPTSLDDTFARDWFSLVALKTATTMEGISVSMSNYSRCGAWEGPDSEGKSECIAPLDPVGGWLNDAQHFGYTMDDGQVYSYAVPITTVGSTGLPDPDIPGGIVPLIAGSDRLAEPEWDDCVWPHSFVVDKMPYPDVPWDYAGDASLLGDTYRFGKDPELDIRMVVNTNIARHYCPENEQ